MSSSVQLTVPVNAGSSPAPSPRTARPVPKKSRIRNLRGWRLLVLRALFGAVLIGAWQAAVGSGIIDRSVVSTPGAVAAYLGSAVVDSSFWVNLAATMQAVFAAFLLAGVVGIVAGLGLGLLPNLEKVVSPYLEALNAMPRIALAPVFVVAFGISTSAKIALAFSIVVFLVLSGARAGIQSADVDLLRLCRVLRLNKTQMFWKVLLPVAMPSIFGALRLGIIYSLLGVVTAELLASRNGIGQMLQQFAGLYRTDGLIGLIIVLAIVATVINGGMAVLERRLLRWQQDAK
jgi:NitT/TauT family transport system permease protein